MVAVRDTPVVDRQRRFGRMIVGAVQHEAASGLHWAADVHVHVGRHDLDVVALAGADAGAAFNNSPKLMCGARWFMISAMVPRRKPAQVDHRPRKAPSVMTAWRSAAALPGSRSLRASCVSSAFASSKINAGMRRLEGVEKGRVTQYREVLELYSRPHDLSLPDDEER